MDEDVKNKLTAAFEKYSITTNRLLKVARQARERSDDVSFPPMPPIMP